MLVSPAGEVMSVEKCDLPVAISLKEQLAILQAARASKQADTTVTAWLLP